MTPPNDPLDEYRRQIRALGDPMKEYREQMKVLSDPLKEYREQMKALSDPLKEYREQMKALSDPLKEYREQMKVLSDPLKEYREQMKALSDPLKEYREQMKALGDPLRDYLEHIKELDHFRGFQEQINALNFDPLERYRKQLVGLTIDPIKDFPQSFAAIREFQSVFKEFAPVTVSKEGVRPAGTKSVTTAELQLLVDDGVGRALAQSNNTVERAIHALTEEIRAIRDPLLQRIMTWLVFPLIVGLILSIANAVSDFYVKDFLADKRKLKKEIKQEISRSVGNAEYIKTYRLVSVMSLNVRAEGAVASRQIGTLQFGQIVELVEKRKNWSLVRWHDDETNVSLQGWVFSRYLEKFR